MPKRHFTGSPRKLLLATVSAMALSVGSSAAVAITVGDATLEAPFFFGDKKVTFDPSGCTDCAGAALTALGGPNIGFRIDFGDLSAESGGIEVPNGPGGGITSSGLVESLGFTVMTTDPLYQIIGVSMSAEAGAIASINWQSNSEDFTLAGNGGSASASADVFLSLSNGAEIANLNDVFDASVENLSIFTDTSDSVDTSGTGGPVGGALSPTMSQDLTLEWAGGMLAVCNAGDLASATCSASAEYFISSIDVRFVQERLPTEVPEPATLGLVGAGLIGLGWFRRRRRAG